MKTGVMAKKGKCWISGSLFGGTHQYVAYGKRDVQGILSWMVRYHFKDRDLSTCYSYKRYKRLTMVYIVVLQIP